MLSSFSQLLWGEEEEGCRPAPTTSLECGAEEGDWVVVGRVEHFPGTLAITTYPPLALDPGSPALSSRASSPAPAQQESEPAYRPTRPTVPPSRRRPAPPGRQSSDRRGWNKKSLKRGNRTGAGGRQAGKIKTFQLRAAGAKRNLKQC